MNNDFDLRGHNYEKDFMAPFYPSASLGAAPSVGASATPSNWKIVSSAAAPVPAASIYEKNSINRADVAPTAEQLKQELKVNSSTDLTTEKNLELDNFQPELQGGFKPIYPPNYRQVEGKVEAEDHEEESVEAAKKPVALALTGAQILSTGVITSSSSSSSQQTASTTTTTTTAEPTTTKLTTTTTTTTSKAPQVAASNPPKKSSFETSLAALLFGEDDDFENEGRKSESKSEPKSEIIKTPHRLGQEMWPEWDHVVYVAKHS